MEDLSRDIFEKLADYADLDLGVGHGGLDALLLASNGQPARSITERVDANVTSNICPVGDYELSTLEQYARTMNCTVDIAFWANAHESIASLWELWVLRQDGPFQHHVDRLEPVPPVEGEDRLALVRPIGRDEVFIAGSPEHVDLMRRRHIVANIKAYLFLMVAAGRMTYADAFDSPPFKAMEVIASSRYAVWAGARWGNIVSLTVWLYETLMTLLSKFSIVSDIWGWYTRRPDEEKVWAEIAFVLFCFLIWYLVTSLSQPRLSKRKAAVPEDRFLGQYMTETGVHYKVRIGGKEHLLLASGQSVVPDHVDEMAMPGSEFFPCKNQPIGAILVATEGSDLSLFGVFWRLDDLLVTARHCSNTLNNSTAKVYAASLRMTKKSNWEIDDKKLVQLDKDFFDTDLNLITSFDVDVFVRECDPKFWAQVAISKASTKVSSAYNLQIHSVGFSDTGLLVSASGRTLEASGHELLYHTASTKKGFSGSIILCGSSVVGMHVSASGKHNVAIRVEWIKYLIDVSSNEEAKKRKVYSYADAAYKDHYREHKWKGGVAKIDMMRDGNMAIVLKDGSASYGWSMHELAMAFGYGDLEKDYDMFEDLIYDKKFGHRRLVQFEDENASITSTKSTKKKPSKKKKRATCYDVETGLKPVHGPKAPLPQPEIMKVMEARADQALQLGYEPEEFKYPDMSPTQERESLQKHLDLFGARAQSQKLFPERKSIDRCARIVAEMMEANAYMPDHDYKTVDGLVRNIINTSIVNNDKSAGYPYCTQGLPKNGQVLERYSPRGFAQEVLNTWDEDFDIKVFLKAEPTKRKKLDAGMPRIICGMPLHVTVKHASIFVNLCKALVDGWNDSPIKYAFVPSKPGHLEHMKEKLPGKVYESDKSNWDFNVLKWMKEVTSQVVTLLAVKPPEWSEQQFCDYLIDVEKAFDQMFDNNSYRTSDGHRFKMKETGIMKSGWFCTIAANSIMQVVIHVMTMMELGYEDDEIINNWSVVAGGDDVNQDLDGVDVEKYKQITASLGVVMEIEERENLESSEYFSSDIRLVKGKLAFFPKRFTKHVEHLKVVKIDDVAQALLSHMENYRHDADKFAYFEGLYHDLRKDYPALFRVQALKSRFALIDKQYGYECLNQF